jgi:hypothetical protein
MFFPQSKRDHVSHPLKKFTNFFFIIFMECILLCTNTIKLLSYIFSVEHKTVSINSLNIYCAQLSLLVVYRFTTCFGSCRTIFRQYVNILILLNPASHMDPYITYTFMCTDRIYYFKVLKTSI